MAETEKVIVTNEFSIDMNFTSEMVAFIDGRTRNIVVADRTEAIAAHEALGRFIERTK